MRCEGNSTSPDQRSTERVCVSRMVLIANSASINVPKYACHRSSNIGSYSSGSEDVSLDEVSETFIGYQDLLLKRRDMKRERVRIG